MKKFIVLIMTMMVTFLAQAQAPAQSAEVKLTEMKGLQQAILPWKLVI